MEDGVEVLSPGWAVDEFKSQVRQGAVTVSGRNKLDKAGGTLLINRGVARFVNKIHQGMELFQLATVWATPRTVAIGAPGGEYKALARTAGGCGGGAGGR